jgi:uncharacterized protein YegL
MQEVFLVRDCSLSMDDHGKARDATRACAELLEELAMPTNRDGFRVCVVDFSGIAKVRHPLEAASTLAKKIAPIQTGWKQAGTNIALGLKAVLDNREFKSTSQNLEDERIRLRPVVLLFTDGGHNQTPQPYDYAASIRRDADLVTVAFGRDADEEMLKRLATSPQHFYRCRSGKDLRRFLAQVGATLTQTLAARQNATKLLATLQR